MNYYIVNIISSLSIIPAVFLIFYRRIVFRNEYAFFACYVIASLASEIISMTLIKLTGENCIWYNVYTLIEVIIVSALFMQWNYPKKRRSYTFIWCSIALIIWLLDNFLKSTIKICNSAFLILFSFGLLFLFITKINFVISHARRTVLREPKFYISIGLLIYFMINILVEVFYLIPVRYSSQFYVNLLYISNAVNIVSNLSYAIAVLCIRKSKEYILLSQ